MKNLKINYLLLIFLLIASSCASRKDVVYLQNEKTSIVNDANKLNADIKLKPGDKISIMVTAEDPRAIQPFNYMNGSGGESKMSGLSYTIDENGNIQFPKIGQIRVADLTRLEVQSTIRTQLGKYIVDPGVVVDLNSFRITLLGEVNQPGVYSVNQDKITLLEGLGLGRDLTIQGVRSNVLVIRKVGNTEKEYRVDLRSKDLYSSPVYYLTQNDVIYVEPNKTKINSSKSSQNNTALISFASLMLSFYALILK